MATALAGTVAEWKQAAHNEHGADEPGRSSACSYMSTSVLHCQERWYHMIGTAG
jgi:hypothetical protein